MLKNRLLLLRAVLLVAAGLLILAGAMAGDDLWRPPSSLWTTVRSLAAGQSYLGGFLLLYVEESGIPLFIPGDVFLVYVGHRLPANPGRGLPPARVSWWLSCWGRRISSCSPASWAAGC